MGSTPKSGTPYFLFVVFFALHSLCREESPQQKFHFSGKIDKKGKRSVSQKTLQGPQAPRRPPVPHSGQPGVFSQPNGKPCPGHFAASQPARPCLLWDVRIPLSIPFSSNWQADAAIFVIARNCLKNNSRIVWPRKYRALQRNQKPVPRLALCLPF